MASRPFGSFARRPSLVRIVGLALMLGVVVIVAIPEAGAVRALADRLLDAMLFRA